MPSYYNKLFFYFLEIACEAPEIPNAQIIGIEEQKYRMSATVQYHCVYRPEVLIEITCDPEGQWRGIQPCTGKSQHDHKIKIISSRTCDHSTRVVLEHFRVNPT